MDLRLATLKAVSLYLPHNVATLNKYRKLSCVTIVCKHFASFQGYPNYRWYLIRHAKGKQDGESLGYIKRGNKPKSMII
jgi:hypothetical protein